MGLFGFNAAKKLAKANEFLERGIFYEARIGFEEILVRDSIDEAIRAEAKFGWKRARTALIREQIEEATRMLQAGDLEQSRECCLAAIEQAGEDLDASEARSLLERIGKGAAQPSRILEGLDDAPARGSEAVPAIETDADSDSEDAAQETFDALLNLLPEKQAEAYRAFGTEFREGYLRLNEGDADSALAAFDQLATQTASHPFVGLERAQAMIALGRFEEALPVLDGLTLPEYGQWRQKMMRAAVLQQLGRKEEALAAAQSLHAENPEDEEALYLCAELLVESGKVEECEALIEPHRSGPLQPELETLHIRCLAAKGDADGARRHLEGLLESFYQSPGAFHGRYPIWAGRELLGLYVQTGVPPERVRALVQDLIGHDPSSADQYKAILLRYAEETAAKEEGEAKE